MSTCPDVVAAVTAGTPLAPDAAAHLAACPACTADAPALGALGVALRTAPALEPAVDHTARVLAAATPWLALHAVRAAWPRVRRAVAVAVLPLPLIVLLDALVVVTAHRLLSAVLPEVVSLWLVTSWAAGLALALAITYAAVPIVAARHGALAPEDAHAG